MTLLILSTWVVASSVRTVSFRQQIDTRNTSSDLSGTTNTSLDLKQPVTFPGFYNSHTQGRGIWKWSNSLDAYQRHFAPMAGQVGLSLGEVGVQSGGSILMWKAVLGAQLKFYGFDINKNCMQFADATTVITIGDQGDVKMWNSFFAKTSKSLDILVDDGSHQPHHMGITLHTVFPNINPGGYVAIEDIHGRHYLQSFFTPAASSISAWHSQNLVASVHVYPFMLIVHKAGGTQHPLNVAAATATVADFPALYPLLNTMPGKVVEIVNPNWGSFLSQATLTKIFTELAPLHDANTWANPPGCLTTADPVCTNTVRNSQYQAQVIGVHVFPTKALVEIAATPPVIHATRKGTVWIPYGF